MGTRNGSGGGILGWEKQREGGEEDYRLEQDTEDCDVGLGLRMQPNNNENNNDTATSSSSSSSSSIFPNRKSVEVSYHPYFIGDYTCGGSAAFATNQVAYMGLGGGGNSSNSRSLLSSDCFPSNLKPSKSLQHNPLSFSGKMAESGNVRAPFTAEQWQELERQNMILKHMMTCASPVPQELQLPVPTKSFSDVAALPSHPNRSVDPEPWRCRRTDGKKWRCSRDVAPHQKYCERHSHKNRPRSRKPVELPAAAATTDYLFNPTNTTTAAASGTARRSSQPQQPAVHSRQALSSHFGTPYDQDSPSAFPSAFASSQPFNHPRCLDWFMKGEIVPTSNSIQEWHHQHQNDVSVVSQSDANNSSGGGSRSNIDPFQLRQSSDYSTPLHSSMFLMEGAVDPGRDQQTRRFIDAWSNADEGSGNRVMSGYSPSRKNNLARSSLTLTMFGGEVDDCCNRMGEKPHWMNADGLWMGSPPGGPLAEALCLGSTGGSVRYQTSPRGYSSVTTTTTTSGRSSSKDQGQEEFNFIG